MDLNHRPLACEASALTTELTAPNYLYSILSNPRCKGQDALYGKRHHCYHIGDITQGVKLSIAKQLYILQGIDLDLETKGERLRIVEAQLSDSRVLLKIRAEVEKKQQQLAELQREQRAAEWEIDDIQARITQTEEKLYGGSLRNPKDLLNLEKEIKGYRGQLRNKEDALLEIMSQVEAIQQEIAEESERARQLEEEWHRKQQQLIGEQAELNAGLAIGKRQRDELAATIDPASLQLYEALRVRKQGQAVAKVAQGRCQGCHLTLTVDELQQARMEELVQCSNCDRILCQI